MSNHPQPQVTIHSKLTVVSSKPIGPGKTRHLTALDHALDIHNLYFVFYYQHNLFGSFELDPLRECLSEVLSLYPIVTGRIARRKDGNWELRCNDAGLRVIRARVDTTTHEWLRSATESQERDLTALEDIPHDTDTWSPFRIQINEFEGGGAAIGLSCGHMLADFTSAISFIKSWTEAYRRLPITHPPLFDQTREAALRGGGGSAPNKAATYNNANPTKPQTKLASATFKFSSSVIEQCLSQVHEISPFDFLSALFWTRIARLKPPKNDQTHSISICVDFRNMLKPALPLGYFGNALHFSKLSLTVKDMESSQLGDVAGLVHSHLAELEDKEEEIWSSMDWLESQREEGGKYRSPNCMYGSELTFVRMEHLILSSEHETEQSLMYAAKFGNNEKPIHVSCYVGNVDREGLIMVMPSPEGGLARTVTVMLAEEQLAELCEDQVIMQLQPTMLLTAAKLSHSLENGMEDL